jgi:tetratricopeptide (TPR) repeat protein
VSQTRVVVPTSLDAIKDLENSAELDLPNLQDRSSVRPAITLGPPTKADDLEVDLADIKAEPHQQPPPPEHASPSRPAAPRLPPPRQWRTTIVAPAVAAPTPTAAAYAGLLGLAAALVALWWVYFSRGQDMSLVASPIAHGASAMSDEAGSAERAEKFAEHLDADTVERYLAALALVVQHGDPVDRAEAALRLHLRYGPDLVRAAQAEAWLSSVPRDDRRADRVRALAAVARGEPDAALALLADAEGPHVALYRGLAAYQAGEFATASAAAAEALSQRPGDQAARWLKYAAELAGDRRASLDPLRAAVNAEPGRTTLHTLLIEALIGRGRLAEARKRLEGLTRPTDVSDGYWARMMLQSARVCAAAMEVSSSLFKVEEATRLVPSDAEVLRIALRVLIDVGELTRAQQGIGALLRDASQDLDVHVLQAELTLRAGNDTAATRAIDRIAAFPKTTALVDYFRGRLALAGGRTEEAAGLFLEAAQADPPHVPSAIEYAKLPSRGGAPEGPALLDEIAAELARDPSERARADLRALTLARVNLLLEAGRRDAAVAALDAALADDPDDNAAQLKRGLLALESGRVDAGHADLLAVYERTGGFPGLIGPLSRLYIRTGQVKKLESMLQLQINDVRAPDEVVLAIARLHLAEGVVEAAASQADQLLLRNPSSWEARLIKSEVLLARGDLQLAQAELKLTRPKQPDAEVELVAGKIHERMGRLSEALAAFRKAHQLAPTAHEAQYLHGRTLLQLGRAQEAVAELTAVTRATDAFPGAFVALGQALLERGSVDEAQRQFQRATVLSPSLAEAYYWLGRSEVERKQFTEATVALGRAVRGGEPGAAWLPDAHLWLARAHEGHADVEAARRAYEDYLRLAPAKAPGRAEAERQLARLTRSP